MALFSKVFMIGCQFLEVLVSFFMVLLMSKVLYKNNYLAELFINAYYKYHKGLGQSLVAAVLFS